MTFAICFDFPEMEGDPVFAGFDRHGLGFTRELAKALKWASEADALEALDWFSDSRSFGSVVEVGRDRDAA